MPVFAYKAIDARGKNSRGHIEAPSRSAAVSRLRQRGLTPFEVSDERPVFSAPAGGISTVSSGAPQSDAVWKRRLRRSVPRTAVAGMARQLATLLRAGLPLDEAMHGMSSNDTSSPMAGITSELREGILAGRELADGLAAYPKVFSSTFVAMVRAGEASGTLELVMERLAAHLEQQVELQRKVRATLAYPTLMLVVGIGIVVFLLSFVIPQVTRIFADMGRELPMPTQILLSLSDGLRRWWWLILLTGGGLLACLYRVAQTSGGRRFLQAKLCSFPLIRGICAPLLLGHMTRTLGMLLKNGVPMLKALQIVRTASTNLLVRESVEQMIDGVQAGRELSSYMNNPLIYPPLARQMIAAGEKSGKLDEMLLWVADDCDSRVAAQLHMLTALMEPVLILIMGTMVGFVVIAIIMPIFEMSTLAG